MSTVNDLPAVVIDNGSDMLKAGFADDELPGQLRTMVSRYEREPDRSLNARAGMYDPMCEYIRTPIKDGVIVNWDDLEVLWDYIYVNLLVTNPAERNLLVLDDLWSPDEQKTQMAEQIFERYSVPGVAVAPPQVAALVATGRMTGLVVDSGAYQTSIVPIQCCNPLMRHAARMCLGGNSVTDFFALLLSTRGLLNSLYMAYNSVRLMKEDLAFVPEVSAFAEDRNLDESYTQLWRGPFGHSLSIGRERYRCAEVVFDPTTLGIGHEDELGLTNRLLEVVQSCPAFMHKVLFRNVVLAGGNTMLPGFRTRLYNEITERLITGMTPEQIMFDPLLLGILMLPASSFTAWRGGCKLCTTASGIPRWTTREDYFEYGPYRNMYCYFYGSPV